MMVSSIAPHDFKLFANRPTLLLSMGYDSVCAWYLLNQPQAIFYSLGSCYTLPEKMRFLRLCRAEPSAELFEDPTSLSWLAQSEKGATAFVPLRNLLLVNTTWARGTDNVVLASATDYGPDKRLAFTLTAELAARVAMGKPSGRHVNGSRGRLRVTRPYRWWTKARLIRATYEKTGTWDWLRFTYSCYRGTIEPCGTCRACRRAAIALYAAGAPEKFIPHPIRRGKSFRQLLDFMPDAFDFGKVPALAELAYYPLRTAMVYQAWKRLRQRAHPGW